MRTSHLMRPSRLLLALGLSFLFSQAAYCQFVALRQASPAEILPPPPQDQRVESEYELPTAAFVVPKERAVTVNLSLDRPPLPRKSQFKLKRTGQVLAEASQDRPEQLEFEVLIEGPVCDVPVYLPVCPTSSIVAAYAQYGVDHPELVVAELAKLGVPDVSVIAVLRAHATERYDGDGLLGLDEFGLWTPYYRVAYQESSTPPLLVKVPRADCELYQKMAQSVAGLLGDTRDRYRVTEQSVANHVSPGYELLVMTISEGNFDSHLPPCHCGPAPDLDTPAPDDYQSPMQRQPGDDSPAEFAPGEALPAAVPGDPFINDEAR